jgi:formyltetrahydrofolate deformylase
MFFQRVEFAPPAGVGLEDLRRDFAAVAAKWSMSFDLRDLAHRPRTAVAVSKPLHCAADVLTRARFGDLPLDVVSLVSNHLDAQSLAEAFSVPFVHVPVDDRGRADQEGRFTEALEQARPDLVLLARYMLVLPPGIVGRWGSRMINIHHSFLPAFVGANPYRQAHDRGVKVIGATAHYVTEVLDEGPIIAQDVAHVTHRDDVAALTRVGRDLETVVLARAVRAHVEHRILTWGKRTVVFG